MWVPVLTRCEVLMKTVFKKINCHITVQQLIRSRWSDVCISHSLIPGEWPWISLLCQSSRIYLRFGEEFNRSCIRFTQRTVSLCYKARLIQPSIRVSLHTVESVVMGLTFITLISQSRLVHVQQRLLFRKQAVVTCFK